MVERIKDLKPLIACFNGKGTYESFSGDKCEWGLQSDPIPGTSTVSSVHLQVSIVVDIIENEYMLLDVMYPFLLTSIILSKS